MSTPSFVAQDEDSLLPIRYHTPFDPYYYTVDNRPLQDLAANISYAASGGGDSARRAALITQLGLSVVMKSLFSSSNPNGLVDGMGLSLSGTSLTVGLGALYVLDVLSEAINTQVLKQALLPSPQTFQLVRPTNTGYSVNYLIQIRYTALTSTAMETSNVPFVDATNTFLPSILLNGEARISIKSGSPAATGSQATPAADSGYMALYVISVPAGTGQITAQMAGNGPSSVGGSYGTPMFTGNTLIDGATTHIDVPLSLSAGKFNPLAAIKVKLLYTSTATSGVNSLALSYRGVASGGDAGAAFVESAVDEVPVPATAGMLGEFTTINAVIPASAFASFSSGTWAFDKSLLRLRLTRKGSDASDTAAGTLTILEAVVTQ